MLEGVARRLLRAVFGGGGVVDIDIPGEFATLVAALSSAIEASMDTGMATGGSPTTIVDTGKSWEANMWVDATFEVEIGAIRYLGIVISNTTTTITFAALPGGATVVAGCDYGLKRPVDIADISDRAARLLGVVYGSQAQQLQQRAATFELLVQLVSAGAQIDPRDVTDRAARLLGVISAGTNLIGAINPRSEAGVGQAPVGVNVTTASTQVLAANVNRKVAIITNNSDTTMWFAIGQAAVANGAPRINANGGVLVISRTGDIYSTEAINLIHASSGNKVATAQELN